jgi:hypothetical protein
MSLQEVTYWPIASLSPSSPRPLPAGANMVAAAQRAAQNIGHNQARMAFMARPR